MSIKQSVKRGLKMLLRQSALHVTANIVQLAPTSLLNGRVALITGGTSGIGYAIADAMLCADAAAVVITGRDEERLKKAVANLIVAGDNREGRVFFEVMDNRKTDTFESHFQNILSMLPMQSGKPMGISILCNNAGILGAQFGTATEEEYDAVLETNLKGVFFLSQLVANYMKREHIEGNILNIASSSSVRPAASAYTLSKWGIKGLTLGMAKSLIPLGIVVNGLAPGPTATPMLINDPEVGIGNPSNPLGRYATAEEIANMAVVLTSGMGRTIVGSTVFMTGGAGIVTYDDMHYIF